MVLVDMPRRDGDQIRLHLAQHGPVIGESRHPVQPPAGGRETFRISIRHRNDSSPGNRFPHDVEAVAVVAPSGVTDDRHAPDPADRRAATGGGNDGGGGQGEAGGKVTSVHGSGIYSGGGRENECNRG